MKVCMLLPFPVENQIEEHRIGNSYVVNLVDALIEEGQDLDMTIFANVADADIHETYRNVKIKRLWQLGKLNPFLLFKETVKLRPDFVHVQYVLGTKFGKGLYLINPFLFMLFLKIARIPLLLTIHDIIPANKLSYVFNEMFKNTPLKSFFYSTTYRLATAFMGKMASRIIVLDEGTKKFSVEQYGHKKSKMTLIPHGMLNSSESITSQEAKKALNINRDCSVLLFFGRIHPRKGIEYAIKALPYVLKKNPNTKLLIAGSYSGSWKKESESYLFSLKEMAKSLDVKKHVVFETRFLGKEIPTLFGASDIVLLPYSVPYGASGVLKLVATHKKTLITPNSLAREGEITDGISGVLLPSLEEKILAQKINQLLEDKSSLMKMGERFYKENLDSSEWRKVAKATFEVYRNFK